MGNLDIEQGIIHGEITYHTDFRGQGHGWEVHSPFDEHASRSKSDKNDIIGVSSTAYAIEWTGDLKHPGNGYDGPQGGGHPTPTGARDEYTYKVKGIADSVDIELAEQPNLWQRFKNNGKTAWDSVKNIGNAWNKATTHNPNLNGWGNLAESGNAVVEGVGSALNVPWVLIGANDAVDGLGVARDVGIMLELNRATPETQLSEVNLLVQGKLGYDGLKESYERWEAENPNAAELVGLGWNALENWVGKKGGKSSTSNNVNNGSSGGLKYEPAPYHSKNGNNVKSPAPTNGQDVLNNSVPIGDNTNRRVGIDKTTGEYVVFDQHSDGSYHGHTRPWNGPKGTALTTAMQNALVKAGLTNRKGKMK